MLRGIIKNSLFYWKENVLLLTGGLISSVALFFSEMSDGGADALVHFGMAEGCWRHPELLLDLWGKPLFTFLSSPFAMGGFKSHQFFNVIVGVLTAYITWRTAEKLQIKNAWLTIPFLCFFPVWFLLSFSTMTEPLFACLLVLAIFFYVDDRLRISAIVVSFLPFARQEGFAFILLFLLVLILRRKLKLIPFLLSGIVFFTLAGSFFLDDLLWVFNNQPYHAGDRTTPGSLFHYVWNYDGLFGIVGSILILLGCVWMMPHGAWRNIDHFILIAGGFWMVLAAHSFVFFKGQAGSIGLLRLMGTVAPLAALLAVFGVEMIFHFLKGKKDRIGIILVLLSLQTWLSFRAMDLPLKNDPVKTALTEFAQTLSESERKSKTIYSTDPQLWFYLERDFWNREKWIQVNHPGHYKQMQKGSLFILENMFGFWIDMNEFIKKENLRFRYTFKPKGDLSFGHGPYCIHVFDVVR